jgi:hypothetical protein
MLRGDDHWARYLSERWCQELHPAHDGPWRYMLYASRKRREVVGYKREGRKLYNTFTVNILSDC